MAFVKAKRENIWVKALLAGPSGSGKSYTALRVATGMARKANSRVAAIDTENGRIRYYANEFDFDDMTLDEPYSPEKYIEAIDEAVDAGYKVLIIDGISNEWAYCNEIHDKMPGNSYTNWAKITPRHNAFMEKILQSPVHIIATVRGKDTYILEDKNGKQVPKKAGVGYAARTDTEYNYSVTFNLSQDTHIAQATKDNTHMFEGRYDVLTEKDGELLYKWANDGETAPPRATVSAGQPSVSLGDIVDEIDALAKELPTIGIEKTTVAETIKGITGGMANYRNIKDVDTANKVLAALKKLKE